MISDIDKLPNRWFVFSRENGNWGSSGWFLTREQARYFAKDLPFSTKIVNYRPNYPFMLGLKDVNHKKRKIVFDTNSRQQLEFSFEYWNDVNKYVNGEWDWKTKTVRKTS